MRCIHNADKNRFDLYGDDGVHLGEIEYAHGDAGMLRATHTKVFKGHEGKGYATVLLDELVRYAKEQSLRIEPECSFVKAAFARSPKKYADVL